MAGKAPHIAGVVVDGDRLTIHLLAPDPQFLTRMAQPIFCAVPSNTPIDPKGVRDAPLGRALLRHLLHPGQERSPPAQPQLPR